MEQKTIAYEGSTIQYSIAGKGMPVILIHGFAEDSTVWKQQVEHLKDHYQVITPDLPGSGKSTLLQKDRIHIDDYADCIKSLADAEKIDEFVLIGHSLGGYITMAFAEKYPALLKAFGLFHSSAYADDTEKIATRKKGIEFIQKNGPAAFLKNMIPGLFYDEECSKTAIEEMLKKGNNFAPEALIQYYEAMIGRPDRTAVLEETNLPVLLILGQHDKAVPFKQGLEQARLPAYTYLYILRNSGHMGMLEETGRANDILAEFLQMQEEK